MRRPAQADTLLAPRLQAGNLSNFIYCGAHCYITDRDEVIRCEPELMSVVMSALYISKTIYQ